MNQEFKNKINEVYMKSLKQKLIERLQEDDDVPLEQSPLPNPFPVWNPFGNRAPAGPPEWDPNSPPWHHLPPDVLHDLIEAWAWHIFNTTGRWPDWYEPGTRELEELDDSTGERLWRWYRDSLPWYNM